MFVFFPGAHTNEGQYFLLTPGWQCTAGTHLTETYWNKYGEEKEKGRKDVERYTAPFQPSLDKLL